MLISFRTDANMKTHKFSEDIIIKLCDFGSADIIPPVSKLFLDSPGSLHLNPPEKFEGKPYDGPKSEMWTVGVIMYALCTGKYPFNGKEIGIIIKKIINYEPKYDPLNNFPSLKHLVELTLKKDPTKRISIDQLKKHPWFVKGLECTKEDLSSYDLHEKMPVSLHRQQPLPSFLSFISFLPPQ